MTAHNLSVLGAWKSLPFFTTRWPAIRAALQDDVLPPPDLTFAALARTQPDATKVVILGQDPYHTPGKADGLAFSIPDRFGGRLDSLGNIFKELSDDLQVVRRKTSLEDWADQGVLLLNTALSVPPGKPKAHVKLGWSHLVCDVLQRLADKPRAFILWGGPAQSYRPYIAGDHLILTSAHPSPLSAYRGFFGSRPFSRVNLWLIEQGEEPINWADP
ncbi:Uracil-DNA glycosylase [Cognatiyoonia koreensis]|uniref:Uracil-DNA glycosylase n=1 Tax=Cognatiyoonia koreensis TaxID=364200 RepID=A0A1I0PKA8_9RHOB|nr:uracil-DNA glycosylase [Cognatiyoonia koreensis]SEW14782.1 Uracil-DNA glycosylase [Cognatiyoonia koreensis]